MFTIIVTVVKNRNLYKKDFPRSAFVWVPPFMQYLYYVTRGKQIYDEIALDFIVYNYCRYRVRIYTRTIKIQIKFVIYFICKFQSLEKAWVLVKLSSQWYVSEHTLYEGKSLSICLSQAQSQSVLYSVQLFKMFEAESF